MRTVTAVQNQTLWDIALWKMGDISGVFDILDMNPFLRLDMAIPAGTIVLVPDNIINKQVYNYYMANGIVPASGLGEEVILNDSDLVYIKKTLNHLLGEGNVTFEGVRLWNLYEKTTIQLNYNSIVSDSVKIFIEQSLDGIEYETIRDGDFTLDPTRQATPSMCSAYYPTTFGSGLNVHRELQEYSLN